MRCLSRFGLLFLAGSSLGLAQAQTPRVQHVSAVSTGDAIEIEIRTSDPIIPQSQTISAPDRIVVDFPGALPASELRSIKLDRGALKAIRTGLFSADPPITRVVLDLSEPESYQIFQNGNMVMLKVGTVQNASQASGHPTASSPPQASAQAQLSNPTMLVNFQHGLLRIHVKKATLAEVLFEVQKQTGAEIPIPAGAEQEEVAADLGPAPPRDVLAALLNGSRYNFIFVDDDRDHSLQKAILSVR